MKKIVPFTVLFILLFGPQTQALAQGIKPDIRNYDVWVDTRPMPVGMCMGFSEEQWIRWYIGFNELLGDSMKFSERLWPAGDQLERASVRLTPYTAKTNMNKTMDEPDNKPTWVGSICYYRGGEEKGQIISDTPITALDPIATMFKRIRFGSYPLSAYIARDHLPLTGGTYNTQREAIEPDPYLQSKCSAVPPGVPQTDKIDKGKGKNIFELVLIGAGLNYACHQECVCKETAMYIKTDSMIQYDTDPLCRTTGCTDEQLAVVDPKSRARKDAKDSGGFINALVRPGLMAQIQEMIIALFGSITGKMKDQETKNRVNERTAPSSYYTTEALEVGVDFLNCKLFPYAKRDEMPQCKTNWLSNIISNITEQLQQTPAPTPIPTTAVYPTPNPTTTVSPSAGGLHGKCEENMPATADEFLDYLKEKGIYWPDWEAIREHYDEILSASKAKGIDPGITMAIWFEESGAGEAGSQFGCTSVSNTFSAQLGCFTGLWDTYATDSKFTECRGTDNQLDLREFMLIFAGGYNSCRSGQFGTGSAFPQKIKNWYDKITDCVDGLVF